MMSRLSYLLPPTWLSPKMSSSSPTTEPVQNANPTPITPTQSPSPAIIDPSSTGAPGPLALQKEKPSVLIDAGIGAIVALPPADQAEFDACEAVVRKGWDTYIEVGLALARIRDKELYRAEYSSFEAYCRFQ